MALIDIVIALGIGFAFGFILDKAGMNRYHKIANVFRYTDLAVLRFMMSAMLVGMVGIFTLDYLGLATFTLLGPSVLVKNVVGGVLFGIGMAAAGFCPGTCVAGAVRGQLDYLIPGILGLITGGLIMGLLYPTDLMRAIFTTGQLDQAYARLPEILNVDPMLLVLVFGEAIFLFLYVVNKLNLRRRDRLAGEEAVEATLTSDAQPAITAQPEGAGD